MFALLRFLILGALYYLVNTQYPATTQEPKPDLCLKETVTDGTNQTKTYVKCSNMDEYPNATYQYPEMETLKVPIPRKCFERTIHIKSPLGKNYYLSWFAGQSDLSWIDARNYCREMCMDLVSLERTSENKWVKNIMVEMTIPEVWTSGRLCNFKGCESYRSPHLWPIEENGWFWAGTGVRIPSYTDALRTDWSLGGPFKSNRQPDNRAHKSMGKTEACISIEDNLYEDGVHWHDELCEDRKPFLCEENEAMLEQAKQSPEFL